MKNDSYHDRDCASLFAIPGECDCRIPLTGLLAETLRGLLLTRPTRTDPPEPLTDAFMSWVAEGRRVIALHDAEPAAPTQRLHALTEAEHEIMHKALMKSVRKVPPANPAPAPPEAVAADAHGFDRETYEDIMDSGEQAMRAHDKPEAVAAEPASSIEFHQRRVWADIVDEAIAAYEQWGMDDDYDADAALGRIIGRMRERRAYYAINPEEQAAHQRNDPWQSLKDPSAVHVNMLRGIIAPITMRQCAHVYGRVMVEWLNRVEEWESMPAHVAPQVNSMNGDKP
jgi:hypothetical protein